MHRVKRSKSRVALCTAIPLAAILVVTGTLLGTAQDQSTPAAHQHTPTTATPEAALAGHAPADLAAQVEELRTKVARLEAAMKSRGAGMASRGAAPAGGMSMMQDGMGTASGGRGMMMQDGMGMPGMASGQSGGGRGMQMGMQMMQRGMRMMQESMQSGGAAGGMADGDSDMAGMAGDRMDMMADGMQMMGKARRKTGGSQRMAGKLPTPVAALPGFPGASRIYHIGATGFFLDQSEHITLSADQQTELARLKRQALQAKAQQEQKIEQAEQELFDVTGADEPDAAQIQTSITEIEALRGAQRLAFIRAVGQAAQVLTDEQRQALVEAAPGGDASGSHATH